MQNSDDSTGPSQFVIGLVLGVIAALVVMALNGGGW